MHVEFVGCCHLKDGGGGGEVCGVDRYPSCSFCEWWWWCMFAQIVVVNYLSNKMKRKKGMLNGGMHLETFLIRIIRIFIPVCVEFVGCCHLKDGGGGEACGVNGYPSHSFCEQWWWWCKFVFGYVVVPCSRRQLSALLMVRNECSVDPCICFDVCE